MNKLLTIINLWSIADVQGKGKTGATTFLAFHLDGLAMGQYDVLHDG
jgi:hypothetical protein